MLYLDPAGYAGYFCSRTSIVLGITLALGPASTTPPSPSQYADNLQTQLVTAYWNVACGPVTREPGTRLSFFP